MFDLKTLSREAVPRALAKAERYRLLNEPGEAESICLDALMTDPDNQEALATLLLALTDQFVGNPRRITDAWTTVERMRDDYERAKALLAHDTPRGGSRAYEWLREAMRHYERAEAIRPQNNDDALLRWNACARLIMQDRHLEPSREEPSEPLLSE